MPAVDAAEPVAEVPTAPTAAVVVTAVADAPKAVRSLHEYVVRVEPVLVGVQTLLSSSRETPDYTRCVSGRDNSSVAGEAGSAEDGATDRS